MKTTIEISDPLLRQAKRLAAKEGTTLRDMVERGLRLVEGEQAWPVLRSLIVDSALEGPQVHDARIAALCPQHGVRPLWSADRDFQRFPALTVVNPLSA